MPKNFIIMKKNQVVVAVVPFLLLLAFIFYGCKKDSKVANEVQTGQKSSSKTIKSVAGESSQGSQKASPNCLGLSVLGWSGNVLQGWYAGNNLFVNNPHWRITCDDGSTIPVQNYQPFYGEISFAGSQGTVLMQPLNSNQFVITYSVWNLADGQAILNGIHNYEQAFSNWLNNPIGPAPDVSGPGNVPASSGSIVTQTGKLVRTTNNTTFGIVGTCYPNAFPCSALPVDKQ
jgi:hypothetical protein